MHEKRAGYYSIVYKDQIFFTLCPSRRVKELMPLRTKFLAISALKPFMLISKIFEANNLFYKKLI